MLRSFLPICLALMLSVGANASTVVEENLTAAKLGDIQSMLRLGKYYKQSGQYEQSYIWFNRAAQRGNMAASYYIAQALEEGKGVAQNLKRAFWHYRKVARRDFIPAQLQVGRMYYEGVGVTKNVSRAFDWLEKAANNGDRQASFRIAHMYFEGEGTNVDRAKGMHFMQYACNRSLKEACTYLKRPIK